MPGNLLVFRYFKIFQLLKDQFFSNCFNCFCSCFLIYIYMYIDSKKLSLCPVQPLDVFEERQRWLCGELPHLFGGSRVAWVGHDWSSVAPPQKWPWLCQQVGWLTKGGFILRSFVRTEALNFASRSLFLQVKWKQHPLFKTQVPKTNLVADILIHACLK